MTRQRVDALPDDDFRASALRISRSRCFRAIWNCGTDGGIGERHGRSAGEVAIAWTLRHPAVTGAIVGMRSAKQVDGVIGAAEFRLSPEEIAEIERFRAARATPVTA